MAMTDRAVAGAKISERERALELAVSQIEKQFGKGAIMRLGENTAVGVDVIPTGAFGLDVALGIGGLPRGRIVEIYGPESSGKTSLCLHAIAEAQRLGGIAAFVDAEHALDVVYARNLGVNVDELLVSQPDTGEQALEITDMLVRSGAVDIIVIDSVAALVPRAEIEGEMGDTHVGLQARLMSQALRKLAGNISRSNSMIIFINQLREKVGVMFGCLDWATQVTLADGSRERISKIVQEKLPVEVLSYDPEAGQIVPRRVVNWFDNGPTGEFLEITVASDDYKGKAKFSATANHKIRTPGGWREAGELQVGERVLQMMHHRFSPQQWELTLGMLLGNADLTPTRRKLEAGLEWADDLGEGSYCEWKAGLFRNLWPRRTVNRTGDLVQSLRPLAELAELSQAVHVAGTQKVFSHDYLKRLTPFSLAVWFMDGARFVDGPGQTVDSVQKGEGCIEVQLHGMERSSRQRLVDYLAGTWDLKGELGTRDGEPVVRFTESDTAKLQLLVSRYVCPSKEYLLPTPLRGWCGVEPQFSDGHYALMPMPILSIKPKTPSPLHDHRYDIEVEGSHNYFADGVMVHNSPETTPGGRALKFYASVRLDIRKIENIKNGTEVTGSRVRVKVVKSKVSAPFRQAEFDIQYGHGISKEGSLLDTAAERGVVVKSGSWYLFDGDQIGQGRENAKAFLAEHPDICDEITSRVKVLLGMVPGPDADADEGADDQDAVFSPLP